MTQPRDTDPGRPLRFALPKGRLQRRALAALRDAGLAIPEDVTETRKLILDVSTYTQDKLGCGMELLLLKNSDVPIYVEHGVADIGVAGTDSLYEADVRVYRPYTFPFGSCTIAIAGPTGLDYEALTQTPVLRVATKFRRFARDHFASQGIAAEIIPLSGSVELAPVLGLADVILDLVETGRTLREHKLHVLKPVGRTHIKLIANATLSHERLGHVERLVQLLAQAQPAPNPT
ncbi:MAG: ATP phosphoribosyltransferase [Myxococcales bacterium]|nr:ATP phosphoribosyltransferase [Myxococcales bacterium]